MFNKKKKLMAKLGSISDENNELVEKIVGEYGLDNYLTVMPLSVSRAKQLLKVQKASETAEYLGRCPDTVCLYIYEAAFDLLNSEQKELLLRDIINTITYDDEKEKIIIGTQSICVSMWGRAKFGESLLNAAECGVMAMTQIEEQRKNKAAKKNGKDGDGN